MMSKFSLFLGALCLFLGNIVLSAQEITSLIIEDKTIDVGDQVTLDLTLLNYDSILGTTFAIFWDTTKLEFIEIVDIYPGMGTLDNNFNIAMAGQGELRYLFFNSNVDSDGVTLDDGTVLFSIVMNVVAEPANEVQQTDITFGGTLEVVDVSATAIEVNFQGSTVTIRGTVDTDEVQILEGFSAVVSPNPFNGDAQIMIEAEQQHEVVWQLSDLDGRLITQGEMTLLPGRQLLSIQNTHFKHTGTYLLNLQTGEKRLTRQLYFIENR